MTVYQFWFDHIDPDERLPELALHVTRYQKNAWNGFHVPLVLASEFVRFIAAWGRNDPDGDWAQARIVADDDTLTIAWGCGHTDVFVAFDGPKGHPVYGIDGFTWAEPVEVSLVFKTEQAARS